MKSSLKKIALGLIGLVPFAALKSPLAAEVPPANKASTPASTPASAIDPSELNDYQDLIRTNYGITSDIIGLNYHDESQTVDLSTYDGNTVTVDMLDMHPVPNGE